jgi:hypothetical protein
MAYGRTLPPYRIYRDQLESCSGTSDHDLYNSRAENRIKEGKDTIRWDKTSCHRFAANQARLLVRCLAYNLLHIIRDAAFCGESVKPSIDSIIRWLVKVGARVIYHTSRSVEIFHVATAFPLARYYHILFA